MKSYGCCDHLEGFWKNLRSKINQVWARFFVTFLSEHPVDWSGTFWNDLGYFRKIWNILEWPGTCLTIFRYHVLVLKLIWSVHMELKRAAEKNMPMLWSLVCLHQINYKSQSLFGQDIMLRLNVSLVGIKSGTTDKNIINVYIHIRVRGECICVIDWLGKLYPKGRVKKSDFIT